MSKTATVFEEGFELESQSDGSPSELLSEAIDCLNEKSYVPFFHTDHLDSGGRIRLYADESADKKRWDKGDTALFTVTETGLEVGSAQTLTGAYVRFRAVIDEEPSPTTTVRATIGLRSVFRSV